MLSTLPSVCNCTECARTNCLQAAVTVAGQGSDGKAVYWVYTLKKEELVMVTKPVVDKIVDSLRNALVEVCVLHEMNGNNNTLQFKDIADSQRSKLGIYYEGFLAAPKYLLVSGGPARMPEIVQRVEQLLVSITI